MRNKAKSSLRPESGCFKIRPGKDAERTIRIVRARSKLCVLLCIRQGLEALPRVPITVGRSKFEQVSNIDKSSPSCNTCKQLLAHCHSIIQDQEVKGGTF